MDAEGKRLFNTTELEYFCRNAYNLGMKHASCWDLQHTIQILTSCLDIIRKFPSDLASNVTGDLSLKALFCHFMISSSLVALARVEDRKDQQLAHYRLMRDHIAAFDSELQSRLKYLDEKSKKDLLGKLSTLFVFDFEGAAALDDWPKLGEIVRKAAMCKSVTTYQAMADCLLRSRAPHEGMSSRMH